MRAVGDRRIESWLRPSLAGTERSGELVYSSPRSGWVFAGVVGGAPGGYRKLVNSMSGPGCDVAVSI